VDPQNSLFSQARKKGAGTNLIAVRGENRWLCHTHFIGASAHNSKAGGWRDNTSSTKVAASKLPKNGRNEGRKRETSKGKVNRRQKPLLKFRIQGRQDGAVSLRKGGGGGWGQMVLHRLRQDTKSRGSQLGRSGENLKRERGGKPGPTFLGRGTVFTGRKVAGFRDGKGRKRDGVHGRLGQRHVVGCLNSVKRTDVGGDMLESSLKSPNQGKKKSEVIANLLPPMKAGSFYLVQVFRRK